MSLYLSIMSPNKSRIMKAVSSLVLRSPFGWGTAKLCSDGIEGWSPRLFSDRMSGILIYIVRDREGFLLKMLFFFKENRNYRRISLVPYEYGVYELSICD